MKKPLTPETLTTIRQRYDNPSGSLMAFENPLQVLRVDFTLREISAITSLSPRTVARHSTNYSFKSTAHKVFCMFAEDYLHRLPTNEVTVHLRVQVIKWSRE